MATGADDDSVASHLLRCGAEADPEVSALLRRAAADAAQHGAPHTAAAYLERALKERAPGDDRGRLLAELATVAFDAGLPDSRERLREALAEAHDRDSRLDVLTRLAALNVVDIDEPGLSALFEQELAAETDPRTRLAIEAAALDTLITIPARHEERARRVAAIEVDAIADPALRRTVLAHRAWAGTERGAPDAAACAALAREALEGDELLHDAGRRAAYHLATRALVMADHADEAHAAIARLRDHAVQRGSLRLHAAAAWYAADLALRRGRLAEAEDEARSALCLVDDDVSVLTGGAASVLVSRAGRARRLRRGPRPAARARPGRLDGGDAVGERGDPRPRAPVAGRGRLRARPRRGPRQRVAARGARAPEPDLDAVAVDRGAGARAPRAPRGGGRDGRRRARAGRALRRAGADRRRAARARGRRARRRRAGGAVRARAGGGRGNAGAARVGARSPRARQHARAHGPAHRGARRAAPRPGRRRRRRRGRCWPSAPGASSWPPACARARRRSRAPRR